jgi:hypothetical protein
MPSVAEFAFRGTEVLADLFSSAPYEALLTYFEF